MNQLPNGMADKNILLQCFDVVQEIGDCHTSVGNYRLARQHYERAASLEPDAPQPYIGLGVIALQNGQLEDADIAFRVARRLGPQNSPALAGSAMVAQRQGDFEQAFSLYLKSLERDTDNLTALLGLFQTSCLMGSFAQVIRYLEIYLSTHPTDASVMFSLAALYMKDGYYEKCRQGLLHVIQLDPGNQDAINLLEETEYHLEKERQALVQKGLSVCSMQPVLHMTPS
jgi:Flp pilus assembly protein TadD